MILPLRCWWQAYLLRYLVSRTRAGKVLFASAISTRQMWGFMVLNYLIVVLTLGLGWPWVMHRTLRLIARPALDLRRARRRRDPPAAERGAALRRGAARHVRRDRLLTMAARARYYDGVTPRRATSRCARRRHELLISTPTTRRGRALAGRRADRAGRHRARGGAAGRRRGEEGRLVVEDAELRRQLAQTVPPLAALGAATAGGAAAHRPVRRRRSRRCSACSGSPSTIGSELCRAASCPTPAGRLGESVAEDLIGRPAALHRAAPGWRRSTGSPTAWPRRPTIRIRSRCTIVEGGPVNAFTLPGGILVFYSDLIDQARDGNEVAGVLAHEMGHVMHYHAIKGLARQYGVEPAAASR